MDILLSPVEVRVLGSLVEKDLTTPEYYPLSLVALVAACNQKSNRDPVMSLTNDDVTMAIETLRGKNLAWQLNTAGGRVPKFEHNLPAKLKILVEAALESSLQSGSVIEDPAADQGSVTAAFNLVRKEIAVLCVLMLRGPLTVGEVRGCTGRMHEFKDLSEVDECLARLCGAELAARLPKAAGAKESRYCHCFCGKPAAADLSTPAAALPYSPSGTIADRVLRLEEKASQLTKELSEIRRAFEEFKGKFD